MKSYRLIQQSKMELEMISDYKCVPVSNAIFKMGAKWMFDRLKERESGLTQKFNNSINFFAYGLFKYSISFIAFFSSVYVLLKLNLLLLPLSILIFYLIEIHFLFLFPILIYNVKNPIRSSIKQTYRTGLFIILLNVIHIGFFMVFGLFNFKDPFRNWYIGCMAIIIWYQDEIRNRV